MTWGALQGRTELVFFPLHKYWRSLFFRLSSIRDGWVGHVGGRYIGFVELKVVFTLLENFKGWIFGERLDLLARDTIKHADLTPGASAQLRRFFVAQ